MSFISKTEGRGFNAGYFLESEVGLVRKTRQLKNSDGKAVGDRKYILAGSLYSGDSDEKGIVYEDIDVTNGDAPGSVVLAGRVYKDRLQEDAKDGVATNTNIVLIENAPTVTRPEYKA